MRDAFVRALTQACARDPKVLLATGDLGFGVLDDFRDSFPEQFLNLGVAEQNLAGVGAGLALAGYTVLTYSIANFPTLRCLEQIRNDICYHGANVKIVAVGGGMAYGALGPSHFATEDLAVMRAMPGMVVVAPGDPNEVAKLVPQVIEHEGPVYLRLGRAGEPKIEAIDATVVLGKPHRIRDGSDVLLLSTGGLLSVVVAAAERLEDQGIDAAVVSMHTLSPLCPVDTVELVAPFPCVVTCEEHTVTGGLGGAVAEIVAESDLLTHFRRFGLRNEFPRGIGSQEFLREVNSLDSTALTTLVCELIRD